MGETRKVKVIAIANQKGGCGKTATTFELASILGMYGYKVLAIDLDGQMHLSMYTGADKTEKSQDTIYRALNGDCKVSDCIYKTKYFDVARGDKTLYAAQAAFPQADDQYRLLDAIEIIDEDMDYDFILIDCSPSRGILQEMAYVASDYCVIPTFVDDGSSDSVMELAADIKNKQKRGSTHMKVLGILYCRFKHTRSDVDTLGQLSAIANAMDTTLFDYYIRDAIALPDSRKLHKSCQEYDKNSTVAIDYKCACYQMLQRMGIDNRKMKKDLKLFL